MAFILVETGKVAQVKLVRKREDWYLPKEGLGHRLGLSHSHIVGLGKDWQCEGSNHSNFCSFWRYPVGEMSHKLTKCHWSIRSINSAPSLCLALCWVLWGEAQGIKDMAPVLRKFSYGYSVTLVSGKNLDENLGFLTSHLHVEGPLSVQHFLPHFPSGPPPHEWWNHFSDR